METHREHPATQGKEILRAEKALSYVPDVKFSGISPVRSMPPSLRDPRLASRKSWLAMVCSTFQCRVPEHYNFFYKIYCTSTQTSFSLCPMCVFSLCLSAPFLGLFPPVSLPLHVAPDQRAQEPNLQSHRHLIQHLGNMISYMIALVYSGKQKMVVIQAGLAVNIQQTVLLLMIRISVSPNEREEYSCLKHEPYKEGSVRPFTFSLHECQG